MRHVASRGRGAARWLALGALAAATAGPGGWFTAASALADSAATVTTTAAESIPGDETCSLAEAIAYTQGQNGADTDCGTKATGMTVINLPEGTYAVPPNSIYQHFDIGSGGPGPIVIAGATGA